ncbi:TrmH family RNA methyltransferase [Tissierellaceae bacterium HCP3S3_D8]
MLEISSRNNPLIKEIKGLYKRKNRWKKRQFIIEGIKIIEEAISNDKKLEHIIYSEKLLSTEEGQQFFEQIKDMGNVIKISTNLFDEISDTDNPQGILAIAEFIERTFQDMVNRERPSLLFLDRIQDPGNMGTIIRTGDAFNIGGILLGEGCVDPYNPKVVRSTMGSIFRVPIYVCDDTMNSLLKIRELGIRILATSLDGNFIYNERFEEAFVCVIGNESKGVDPEIMSMADRKIKIPMPGRAESLNAGVAASIIMYETMKWRI